MNAKFSRKPLSLALGAAFALTGTMAHASVFQVADLGAGYMVAQAAPATPAAPAKGGELKCGAECMKELQGKGKSEKDAKAACDKAHAEGKCGGAKAAHEGKCGEGKCGGAKKAEEGKCGEGKCGGKK